MAEIGNILCRSQTAVSLHNSLLKRGTWAGEAEAEAVTEPATGAGKPDVSLGNGVETRDRRGAPSQRGSCHSVWAQGDMKMAKEDCAPGWASQALLIIQAHR